MVLLGKLTLKNLKMSNRLFTTVPVPRFPRSNFNLSRPVLFTPRMHKEYPSEIIEIIPGDGMKIHTEAYAKSQPMVAPTFAKMDVAQESFLFLVGSSQNTLMISLLVANVALITTKCRLSLLVLSTVS